MLEGKIQTTNKAKNVTANDINVADVTSEMGNSMTISIPVVNKLVKKKLDTMSRKYIITVNNYTTDNYVTMLLSFREKGWKYIVGKEIGEKGTPHLQIYIEHFNPIRFSGLQKIIPRGHILNAKGNITQNYIYCSKDGDFVTNIKLKLTRDEIKRLCLIEQYKNVVWRPYQKEILDLCNKPANSRTIHWYYDKSGNTGKSFLMKYIGMTYEGVIIGDGKKSDIFNQVNCMLENGVEPVIILVDLPRHNKDFFNYGCIEQLKNGCFYSGKYEGGLCYFKNPIVIIFSNDLPDIEKWSIDRYYIYNIKTNKIIDNDLLLELSIRNAKFYADDEND